MLEAGFLPAIRKISKKSGVSCKTVHKALKSLAAEGIIAAESNHGYRVVPPRADDPTHAPLAILAGVPEERWNLLDQKIVAMFRQVAAARHRALLVIDVSGQSPVDIVNQLTASKPWGIVLDQVSPELARAIRETTIPAVMVDSWVEDAALDSVVQDNFHGAMQATTHLLNRKHKRIAWLGTSPKDGLPQTVERFSGAIGALARAGRTFLPGMVPEFLPGTLENYLAGARQLLALPERPTALLALWQVAVEAVTQAAREKGIVIGRDLDLVGWVTDEGYDSFYRPLFKDNAPPPAMTWSVAAMAEAAVARLEERRAHPNMPPMQVRIPMTLRFQ